MHTLMVIGAGLVLLLMCLGGARLLLGSEPTAVGKAVTVFLPLWLLASVANLWVGVTHAGYTIAQELPILAVVYLVPAAAAVFIWRFRG